MTEVLRTLALLTGLMMSMAAGCELTEEHDTEVPDDDLADQTARAT